MVSLSEFLKCFAEELDYINSDQIQAETRFKELSEWSSLLVLSIITMIKEEYCVVISPLELKEIDTIKELYDKIMEKASR